MTRSDGLIVPSWPKACLPSTRCELRVNGIPVLVHANPVADFAYWECSRPVEVELRLATDFSRAEVRPNRLAVDLVRSGNALTFTLSAPRSLYLEVDGHAIFLYVCAPDNSAPKPNADVFVLPTGEVTNLGEFELKSGQTLHIPAGAVARGLIRARNASNVSITGRGILDGGLHGGGEPRRTIVFEHCTGVRVRGILMVNPSLWMLTLGRCRDVLVDGLRQIGEVLSSDGIDIVGSSDVVIQNCVLKNNDDCIAIKSLDLTRRPPGHASNGDATLDWSGNVSDILIQDCLLGTHQNGTAMEIGHELRCDSVSGIAFRNIDVLCVHRHGSVFGIHNADGAVVRNILWENVYVDHHYDKLIDFRTVPSRWSDGKKRGRIQEVRFENIRVRLRDYNIGYSTSLMGGYDADHGIDDVVLCDFIHGDKLIESVEDPQLDLYLRHARSVRAVSSKATQQ